LFLAAPVANKGSLTQYMGRILRSHENKTTAEVHDYLDERTGVLAAMLAKRAPGYANLGFPDPLADRVHHSRLNNLKELRPGSAGRSEIRILYVFDPRRNAVLLAAGDKAGKWEAWYRRAIPLAEQRYEDYLKQEDIR
jgi:hypothetical protein